MRHERSVDPIEHRDLCSYENGQTALSGSLAALSRRLDGLFLRWARGWQAEEHVFPTFLPAAALARIDYFRSFPQLVTFPTALDPDADNLARFAAAATVDESGAIKLGRTAPIRDVLTPAACYHVYLRFEGESLRAPCFVTTRATCYRRESHYLPLRRQSSFSMREIVCLGTRDEVSDFLDTSREWITGFFRGVGLPIEWRPATDPFFNPAANPRYLLQKIEPVKTEMVFGSQLAIGSINFHRNYFGETFTIERDGEAVFSGCVAFGIERWIYAFLDHFGMEPSEWPAIDSSDA